MSDVTVSANVDAFLQAANFAAMRTALGVDAAGTDNSTDVTFTGSGTYISLSGQEITVDPITESDITDLGDYVDKSSTESIGGVKTFSSNAIFSSDLTVDTNTLYVDSSNNRVGIGTASPSYAFDQAGNAALGSGTLYVDSGGSVGIGTTSPSTALDVSNDITAGGVVYTYDLDVANNATISSGYLACSTFYDGGGSSQWGSESGGTFTFNGGVNISGQAEATSQAASTDNSLMTRSLVDTDRWLNSARLWSPLVIPSFTKTGTGSVSQTSAGDAWVSLQSGTSNSGYGKAVIGRGLNSAPGLSGAGIYFSKPIGFSCNIAKFAANDESNRIRIIIGTGTGAPAAAGDDPISDDGFGVEIKRNATHTQWRVFAHNGTTLTATTFANLYSGTRLQPQTLAVYSNGSGTITAYYGNYGADSFSTISTTGGPTGTGASATSRASIEAANSSSGTATSKINVYSCKFYTPDN